MTQTREQHASALPGPRATAALTVNPSWAVALEHAADGVMSPGDPAPDVLLLFASPAYGDDFEALVRAARRRTGAGVLVGCSASGVLAGTAEIEDQPALALMAWWLPGVRLHPVRLHQEHIALLDEPELWHEVHGVPRDDPHSWLMFAEPYRIDAQALIQGLERCYPAATMVGGIASGLVAERTSCVFFDDMVYTEGGVALGIGGPYAITPHVAQGCGPVGEPWTITEAEHNLLVGISNRPALTVLQATINGLDPERRDQASKNLVVGLAGDEYRDSYGCGDFAVRGILGIDAKRGAIAIGGKPRTGQTMQFHLREARTASVELARVAGEATANGDPAAIVAAVLCTCDGRGQALFGVPDHDTGIVAAALPGVPLAGAFCLGEIGPLGDRTMLHGFTATLGMLRHTPAPDPTSEG